MDVLSIAAGPWRPISSISAPPRACRSRGRGSRPSGMPANRGLASSSRTSPEPGFGSLENSFALIEGRAQKGKSLPVPVVEGAKTVGREAWMPMVKRPLSPRESILRRAAMASVSPTIRGRHREIPDLRWSAETGDHIKKLRRSTVVRRISGAKAGKSGNLSIQSR